jgi:DNA polymerase-1
VNNVTPRPCLWLLDGTYFIFRAYFALRGGFTTRDGLSTNAVYGFTTMLRRLMTESSPEYLAVCFDRGEKTFRHEEYPDYKANRPEPPEDLIPQFDLARQVAAAHNLPALDKEGWEADDLIGTLARKAEAAGFQVVVVTADKDLYQLVNEHVRVMNPGKEDLMMDADMVKEVFGVRPDQVIDVLALMGDASDNIPGVKGIGQKGARKLLEEYGSLDNLLAHADQVKGKAGAALVEHADLARLSYRLATIDTGAPVDFDPESFKVGEPDRERLRELFTRLEFQSMLAELRPDAGSSAADYQVVTTRAGLQKIIHQVEAAGRVSVDLETTSVDAMTCDILGIALTVEEGKAVYVPVRHEKGATTQLTPAEALSLLEPVLAGDKVAKIAQNAKYEYLVFRRAGIRLRNVAFDTMLAAYLLNPSRSHKLDDLAGEYLDYRMIPYTDLAGKGAKQVTLDQVELARVVEYAGEDADITLRLADLFAPRLREAALEDLFTTLEMPLLPVLAEMEYAGVRVDVDHLKGIGVRLEMDLARIETEIHAAAGTEFNINSPKQLGEVLFQQMGIKPRRKTAKTKAFSTSQAVLEELALGHPICGQVLEWRSLAKLKGTYVDALPEMVHPDTGRVHTSFNQAVAATGRLSSSDPNLQNIPVRTAIGREIRRAFIADPGHVLLTADYSQVELRILAHLTGDTVLIQAFADGEDIHARTAAAIFGVHADLVSDEMRRRAKAINFGILYGMGPMRLAREQGITMKEAQAFIAAYFERFARVKEYIDETIAYAEEHGYVKTLLDRVRYFPELQSGNQMARQQALRAAVNTTIQGTAADLIKKAMLAIDRRLGTEKLQTRMILQVHDELVLEVPQAEIEAVAVLVREEMEGVHPLDVPLTVDLGWGPNWVDAKPA